MTRRLELQQKLKYLDGCQNARDDIDYIFDITGKYTDGIPTFKITWDGANHWTKSDRQNFKELDKLRKKTKKKELIEFLKFVSEFYMTPLIPVTAFTYDRNSFVCLMEDMK